MSRYLVSLAYEVEAESELEAIVRWTDAFAAKSPPDTFNDFVVVELDDLEAPR